MAKGHFPLQSLVLGADLNECGMVTGRHTGCLWVSGGWAHGCRGQYLLRKSNSWRCPSLTLDEGFVKAVRTCCLTANYRPLWFEEKRFATYTEMFCSLSRQLIASRIVRVLVEALDGDSEVYDKRCLVCWLDVCEQYTLKNKALEMVLGLDVQI